MKLSELKLNEMPIKIKAFPSYSDEQLETAVKFFDDARVIEKIEIDYKLLEKQTQYALRTDGQIVGFATTEIINYFKTDYLKIKMIYVFEQFRNKKIGLILVHGIKEVVNLPLICDDVISDDGLNLLISISKNKSVFGIKSLDKQTGVISTYKNNDERDMNVALIVENKTTGLFREGLLPGSSDRIYLKFIE